MTEGRYLLLILYASNNDSLLKPGSELQQTNTGYHHNGFSNSTLNVGALIRLYTW